MTRTPSRRVRRAALTPSPCCRIRQINAFWSGYLRDRDAELRAAAAEGLGRLKDPSDLGALERGYEEESRHLARLSFAFALVTHGKLELTEFSPLQYMVNTLNSAPLGEALGSADRGGAGARSAAGSSIQPLRGGTRDEKIGLARVMAAQRRQGSGAAAGIADAGHQRGGGERGRTGPAQPEGAAEVAAGMPGRYLALRCFCCPTRTL